MTLAQTSFPATVAPHSARPALMLRSREGTLIARGVRHVLEQALEADLLAAASKALSGGTRTLLVGALPFDRRAAAHLVCPESWRIDSAAPKMPQGIPAGSGPWSVVAQPAPAVYQRAVREALARIRTASGERSLSKVVLARALDVTAPEEIDPHAVFMHLLHAGAQDAYCVPLPSSNRRGARTLVGASPELLIEKKGLAVTSLPMAGSAPRRSDPRLDREVAGALAASAKDQVEHRLVVEAVLDVLAPHCRRLDAPARPVLVSTPTMWHLATPIHGVLDREISCLELAGALHPTPAVCGTPRDEAAALIRQLEPFDRGFFGGTVGWCDGAGDGRWMVTIRCAEIAGRTARVFAGAGIVRESDPSAELEETTAKFRTMLRALGVDADTHAAR